MIKFLKKYFSKKLTHEELVTLLIASSTFSEEGDHLMDDGRTVFSRAGRDPEFRNWIERRKANLLKYATIDGQVPRIRAILAEYEMVLRLSGSAVEIPKSDPIDTSPEVSTADGFKKMWELSKNKNRS